METTNQNISIRKITAAEGHLLTKDPKAEYPYFCKQVYLGVGDSPENYTEVTEAQAAAIMAAAEAARETRMRESSAAPLQPDAAVEE